MSAPKFSKILPFAVVGLLVIVLIVTLGTKKSGLFQGRLAPAATQCEKIVNEIAQLDPQLHDFRIRDLDASAQKIGCGDVKEVARSIRKDVVGVLNPDLAPADRQSCALLTHEIESLEGSVHGQRIKQLKDRGVKLDCWRTEVVVVVKDPEVKVPKKEKITVSDDALNAFLDNVETQVSDSSLEWKSRYLLKREFRNARLQFEATDDITPVLEFLTANFGFSTDETEE